jgi:hypothetical protein
VSRSPTTAPTSAGPTSFIQSGTCTQNVGICGVTCAGVDTSLNALVVNGTNSRVFQASDSTQVTKFIVPICGARPALFASSTQDLLQKFTNPNWAGVGLGTLSTTSWVVGTFNSQTAFRASFLDGNTDPGCPSGGARHTDIVIVCDRSHTSASPAVDYSGLSLCYCKLSN